MSAELEAAYGYCREVTRRCARNFYYGLKLTPEPKRSALYVVYAFMRRCDDLADEAVERGDEEAGLARIEGFREQMRSVLAGGDMGFASGEERRLWVAFGDVMEKYPIDAAHLHAMLDGQAADMHKHRYATFEELDGYCYNVAGTVGLVCLSVWGHDGSEGIVEMAKARGLAFQMTNILRDVVEDAERGRIYLPGEEMARFGCGEADLVKGGEGFEKLMRFQVDRALGCYEASRELEGHIDPACRGTSLAMMRIYRGILEKISVEPTRVLRERVRLSAWQKTRIALAARMGR